MARRRCVVANCPVFITTGSRCPRHHAQQKSKYQDTEYQSNRELVLARDGYRCQIRGPRCLGAATECDHIDPSGGHELWNMQASCKPCNSGKRDRL